MANKQLLSSSQMQVHLLARTPFPGHMVLVYLEYI